MSFWGERDKRNHFYALIVQLFKKPIYSYIKIQSSSIYVSKLKDFVDQRKTGQFFYL